MRAWGRDRHVPLHTQVQVLPVGDRYEEVLLHFLAIFRRSNPACPPVSYLKGERIMIMPRIGSRHGEKAGERRRYRLTCPRCGNRLEWEAYDGDANWWKCRCGVEVIIPIPDCPTTSQAFCRSAGRPRAKLYRPAWEGCSPRKS